MQVYKSKYADAYFNKEKKLFTVIWKKKNNMSEDSFKKTLIGYIEKILEYKPLYFLLDASEIFFPVDPKLQIWMNENSLSKTRNIIRKEAVVVKNEIIMYLSAEQTLDSEEIKSKERKIFYDKQKALEWLLQC